MSTSVGVITGITRWWVSWVCREKDYRPVLFPVQRPILAWWCSGFDHNSDNLVALLECATEQECRDAIAKHWPEFHGQAWRFCENKGPDFLPNDRFPMPSEKT